MSKEISGDVRAWESPVKRSPAVARKRANTFFSAMSVAPTTDDDEHEPGEIYHSERVFPNGDFYTGQCCDNLPHGNGKYLWTDGCMYVGEWHRGKTMGIGKFSWPSGATYEGDFKNGYMDGKGTYTGSSGDTYRGFWVMNLKHGQGTKSFSNGDYYEGEWRRGLQDGQGRYQWKNGNHYIGQWKNGMMNGNGTMIWSGSGNRYDGYWEDGLPKGNGTFRWDDGSFYVGVWSKDPNEQNGTYYPAGSPTGNSDWDPQQVFLVDLKDCKVCPGEKISLLPSQKMTIWSGYENCGGKPRRMSVDGRISNYSCENDCNNKNYSGDFRDVGGDEGMGSFCTEDSDIRPGRQMVKIHPMKKQGHSISKGHKNYELMLNLQLGIRYFASCDCFFKILWFDLVLLETHSP